MELIIILVVTLGVILSHIMLNVISTTPNKRILAFYGIPAIFVGAMLATPPDAISMLILAVPASILYSAVITVWIVVGAARTSNDRT